MDCTPQRHSNLVFTYINGITVRGVAFRGAGKPTGSCIEIEALRRDESSGVPLDTARKETVR